MAMQQSSALHACKKQINAKINDILRKGWPVLREGIENPELWMAQANRQVVLFCSTLMLHTVKATKTAGAWCGRKSHMPKALSSSYLL
ncbi:hypothetical protein NC653_018182 [Populus alba x Populus x berolinensis]|uniref:Uncharacterized protein n=1 Tax=Populus alba x Populus x berolinensis TaxID=444605 RepID=A0AAD6QFW4_9ROSI|nr:hypothetical protein NC653_018182 [Populus alba x Populus x berolinensis]